MNPVTRRLITTKNIAIVTLLVITLTILAVWLFGLGEHRTLFVNSILSTSILSASFFFFLSISLYKGIKMKDDVGKITDNIKRGDFPNFPKKIEFPDVGD